MDAPDDNSGNGRDGNGDKNNGDNDGRPRKLFHDDAIPNLVIPSHVSIQTTSTADLTPHTEASGRQAAAAAAALSAIPERSLQRRRSSSLNTIHETHPNQVMARSQFSSPRLRQIAFLSGTSVVSTVAFVASILPTAAFLSLSFVVVSVLVAIYLCYLYICGELHTMIRTRGIGAFIPSSWYQLLTEQSVHDFMTDDTFARENRHVMIYLLPGLTPQQRTDYIERLGPRHRQQLLRPGMGYFLGDNFMRLLMGEERYQGDVSVPHHYPPLSPQARRQQQPQPTVEVIMDDTPRSRISSRRDTNASSPQTDQDSDGDESNMARNAEQMAETLTDEQAVTMMRSLGIQRRPSHGETAVTNGTVCGDDYDVASLPDEDSMVLDEIDFEEEERVLTEAFMNSMYDGIWAPFQRYWVRQLRPMADSIIQFSASVTLASLGLGVLSHRYQSRSGWSVGRGANALTLSTPPSRLFLGTALVGGIATGATMLFRWQWLRPAVHRRRRSLMTPRRVKSSQSLGSEQRSGKP